MVIVYWVLFLCLSVACFFPRVQGFSDEWLRPKWFLFEFVGLILCIVVGIHFFRKCKNGYYSRSNKNLFSYDYLRTLFCVSLAFVAFIEAVYAVVQSCFNGDISVPISGTFDNPAGLAFNLCTVLPFYFYLWRVFAGNRFYAFVIVVSGMFVVLAILLSLSRTGWICLTLFIVFFLRHPFFKYRKVRWGITLGCIGGLLYGISSFKMDSTNGRYFILERSWELISERPLKGYGIGGFHQEYMLRQADYFRNHTDSSFAWLADEVYHPLNEFVFVWIEFGILGMFLLFCIFLYMFSFLRKERNSWSFSLIVSFCSIFIFCLFSYPFKYPLTILIFILGIVSIYESKFKNRDVNIYGLQITGAVGSFVSTMFLCFLLNSYTYENKWSRIAKYSMSGRSSEMMPLYADLYKHYRNNALFLYNYTAEQFYANQYDAALKTAKECMQYWPSYNLCLLTGDICRAAGRYDEAVEYYWKAHYMCPVRFAPLEGLYYAYRYSEKNSCADSIAMIISNKRIKVNSVDVQRIKCEISKDLDSIKQTE